MVIKVAKPKTSIRQRASAIKHKQDALRPKKVVVPIKKKIIVKKVVKPIVKTISKKIIKPAAKSIVKPATVKVAKPTVKPTLKKVIRPTTKPIIRPAVSKVAKPIIKSATKPVTRPATIVTSRKISGNIEEKLIENFISLQKVMVNLSVKFDGLSNQISKLLQLFEISAKSLAEKDFNQEKQVGDTVEIKDKVTNLFEQNKVIARGLTILHEKMFGEEIPLPPQAQPPAQGPPKQRMPMAGQHPPQPMPRAPPPQGPPIRRGIPPPPRGPPQQAPQAPQQTEDSYEKSLSNPNPSQQQFKKLPGPTGQSV